MERWLNDFEPMLNYFLGNPVSDLEKWVALVLAVLAMMWTLTKAGTSFGIPNTGVSYALFTALLGIVLTVAATLAAKFYLPGWGDAQVRILMVVGAGVLVAILVVAPLMCALQKSGYLAAVLTWAASVAAAAAVILLVGGVFELLVSGGKDAEKSMGRKQDMEKFLQNQ